MQVSINWLKQYIDLTHVAVQKIADTLTALGLEVEEVQHLQPVPKSVVVGRILQAEKHPNADSLQICQVSIGAAEPLRIVCGAANARKDLTVAVATIGTVFSPDFKIKESKIRGELSQGMLCSEKELGLSESHAGIMELPADLKLGTSLAEALALQDTIMTIKMTPNRADCLSYIGLARDLAGKLELPWRPLGKALTAPEFQFKNTKTGLHTSEHCQIHIEDDQDCVRFSALYISGVHNVPSPFWLQRAVTAAGMRPINVIVDVTNFVMLELGNPIHAYDERSIAEKTLTARRAKAGETLTTLDGVKRTLVATDLVIADGRGPVGLAGVMGGADSEVKADTKNIVVEVAHFNPSLVRKTAKRFALHSEASHRFERGVDATATLKTAWRVAELLTQCYAELKLSAPSVAAEMVDIYPKPLRPKRIALRLERVRQITGLPLLRFEDCKRHLEAIGFVMLDFKDERLLFEIPTWRHDIDREIDLVEEVARLYGYDKITSSLPLMEIGAVPENPFIDFSEQAKVSMAQLGLTEIISFPFISRNDLKHLRLSADHPWQHLIELQNAMVEEQSALAPTLVINLLKAVGGNRNRGAKGVRLFESQRTFLDLGDRSVPPAYKDWQHLATSSRHISERAQKDKRAIERCVIAGVLDQPFVEKTWRQPETAAGFFDAKDIVTRFLQGLGTPRVDCAPITAAAFPWLNPNMAAHVWAGERWLGYIGEIHPETAVAFNLDPKHLPIVFELDLDLIYQAKQTPRKFDCIQRRFPPVSRDLALVVAKSVTHHDFEQAVHKFKGRKFLTDFRLFDVYEGKNIPEGKKSMAYALNFQSPEKTLTEKDIEKEMTALLNWFKETLKAELR